MLRMLSHFYLYLWKDALNITLNWISHARNCRKLKLRFYAFCWRYANRWFWTFVSFYLSVLYLCLIWPWSALLELCYPLFIWWTWFRRSFIEGFTSKKLLATCMHFISILWSLPLPVYWHLVLDSSVGQYGFRRPGCYTALYHCFKNAQ